MKPILLLFAVCFVLNLNAQDTITKADIPAAAKLMDLSLTPTEVDTMYATGVKKNLLVIKNMHKLKHNMN